MMGFAASPKTERREAAQARSADDRCDDTDATAHGDPGEAASHGVATRPPLVGDPDRDHRKWVAASARTG